MIEHRFRQSWLNSFQDCPEKARTIRNGTAIDVAGSKAVRGTAVHAAIETALTARMAGQELTVDTVLEAFHWSWDSLVGTTRSEEHTSELQSRPNLVRLLLLGK